MNRSRSSGRTKSPGKLRSSVHRSYSSESRRFRSSSPPPGKKGDGMVATDWPRTLRGCGPSVAISSPFGDLSDAYARAKKDTVLQKALDAFDARARDVVDKTLVAARRDTAAMRIDLQAAMIGVGGPGSTMLQVEQHLDSFDRLSAGTLDRVLQRMRSEHREQRNRLRLTLLSLQQPRGQQRHRAPTTLGRHTNSAGMEHQLRVENSLRELELSRGRMPPASFPTPGGRAVVGIDPSKGRGVLQSPPRPRVGALLGVLPTLPAPVPMDRERPPTPSSDTSEEKIQCLQDLIVDMFEQQRSIMALLGPVAEKIAALSSAKTE